MDEEKDINTQQDEEVAADTQTAENKEELEQELEELKDTFQEVLDETTAQAQAEPEIQGLDYVPEETEDEASDLTEENDEKPEKKEKKDKTKKKRKVPLAAVIIPVVLCVLIIIPLFAYFILSVTVPDFSGFLNAYVTAYSAETADEKVSCYTTLLEYCEEGSKFEGLRQEVLEKITAAKCESEGYAAAYSYMQQNLTEDMIASPKTDEFKEVLKIADQLTDIAGKVFDEAVKAVGDKKDASDVDVDAIVNSLGVSSLITDDVKSAVTLLCDAAAAENSSEDKDSLRAAISGYLNAYSILSELGADGSVMLERVTVKLYNYGFAYEAKLITTQYLGTTDEDGNFVEYKTDNEDYNAVIKELEALTDFDKDIFALAVEQYEKGEYTEDDFKAAFKNSKLSDKAVNALVQMCITATDAFDAEKEKNLTKAVTYYETLTTALAMFEFNTDEAAEKAIAMLIKIGDTQTANTLKETYFADENKKLSASAKATLEELEILYNAQDAANETFYPFYYNAYYYGSEMNKDEIIEALDALITDESNDFDKAFVEYYKYYAESFTDNDTEAMTAYLENFAAVLKDYPMLYGYALAQNYQQSGEYKKAEQIADEMLNINIADDFANSIKAFVARTNKDVDTALKTAEKGMELSGATDYCGYEAAIGYMLKGDFEKAFEIAKVLYNNALTTKNCELIMVIAQKYDGKDETVKAELESLSAEISDTYASYGIEASDAAKGIINGSLSLEDVFLEKPYAFE